LIPSKYNYLLLDCCHNVRLFSEEAARLILKGIEKTTSDAKVLTKDLGGQSSTIEVTREINQNIHNQ